MSDRKIPAFVYVIVAIVAVAGASFYSYTKAFNAAVDFETRIEAQLEQNQNSLSQYTLKVKEAVQVPGMYADDFNKMIISSMTGRYGTQGSQATFQWLKEHEITLPSELYLQVQQIIESGRNAFENEQKKLIDLTRSYKKSTRLLWTGLWMSIAGFPSDDWDWSKYEALIDSETQKSFDDAQSDVIKLR